MQTAGQLFFGRLAGLVSACLNEIITSHFFPP
jgi:hypothetical protein